MSFQKYLAEHMLNEIAPVVSGTAARAIGARALQAKYGQNTINTVTNPATNQLRRQMSKYASDYLTQKANQSGYKLYRANQDEQKPVPKNDVDVAAAPAGNGDSKDDDSNPDKKENPTPEQPKPDTSTHHFIKAIDKNSVAGGLYTSAKAAFKATRNTAGGSVKILKQQLS